MGLVNLAHFATPESLLFLLMVLTLFACDRVASDGRARDYALAGLFAGLAFATKYTAWILAVPILAAHAYRVGWGAFSWRSLRTLMLCGVVGFAAFAATNPYAFIRWHDFVYWGFWFNWYTGAPTGSLVGMSQFQRSYGPYFLLLGDIMGWPLFVTSLAGVVVGAAALWRGPHRRPRPGIPDSARVGAAVLRVLRRQPASRAPIHHADRALVGAPRGCGNRDAPRAGNGPLDAPRNCRDRGGNRRLFGGLHPSI
jgi:hypothetical protein